MSSKRVDGEISGVTLSPDARALLERRSKISAMGAPTIPARESDRYSPLSSAQETVWLSSQIDRTSSAFNRCTAMRITGSLDRGALQRALTAIVQRHAILRSHVVSSDAETRMTSSEIDMIALPVTDLSLVAESGRPDRLKELLDAEVKKPFDVHNGPWIRAGLISENNQINTLFISTHHIASDGWSDAVMFRELNALYGAFVTGKLSPLNPLAIQFSDFAVWQRERAESPEIRANVQYWRDRMAGAPVSQQLPLDRPRRGLPDMSGGEVRLAVRQEIVDALTAIGREQSATMAMTTLAAFHLLQFRITGQSDSIVGLSLAGRLVPEVGDLIGLFNSVLPLQITVDRAMTFRSLLETVRIAVLEAQTHQELPVCDLMDLLSPSNGARRSEIGQTLFNFRNMPAFEPSLPGLKVEELDVFNGGSVADLQLELIENKTGLECAFRFRNDVFDRSTAVRLLGHYVTLLESISFAPDQQVGRLQIFTANERRQILTDFRGPVRDFPPAVSIDQLFSEQALKTPNATAVTYADGAMTYHQLAVCSDSLGRELRSHGVIAGDLVGVCMDRSPQMIVSLFAILKCGAAFVPLDVDYPPARLEHMLSDTHPSLLLADATGESVLGSRGVDVFIVGTTWLEEPHSDEPPFIVERQADATACVLYTSGSTGLPKGVLSTHRGIVNNLRAMQDMYPLTPDDCLLQQTSLGFDAAAWEIFWPLSVGARMYLAQPGGQRDADYVVSVIESERIATVGFAPSMLKVVVRMTAFTGNRRIKRVMSYGEVLSPSLVNDVFALMPDVEIHNLYGPTETSIAVTTWNCERHTERRSIPVGLPVPNTELYILDPWQEPVSIGVEGEIYIGGICVSNGYHDRENLTSERFLTHPFRPDTGDRVYRTGDIARFGADGAIEYRGRRDHQLKIRGLRVEVEEVEAALCQLPGIRESVVVVTRDSDDEPRLIAYVAVDDNAGSPPVLRKALEKQLPPQFLPAQIICLDELPHSLNGKIDRQRLPYPASIAQIEPKHPERPLTELEARLTSIWKEFLSVSDIGVTDSFFNLGGHSLLAARMLQRVADDTGVSIALRVFYASPAIETLAQLVGGKTGFTAGRELGPALKVRGNAEGSPILFYFNGQPSGGGRYAENLASYLPNGYGLFLVPVPIFHAPVKVESLASRMVDVIRSEQQKGPFLLGGNCFGATLALEIAQQLRAASDVVALLVLVHPDARNPMHLGFRAVRRATLLGGLPEEFHFDEFSGPVQYAARAAREIWRELRRNTGAERRARLVQMARWIGDFTSRNARKPLSAWSSFQRREARELDDVMKNDLPDCLADAATQSDNAQAGEDELRAHAEYMSAAWTAYTPRLYAEPVAIIWPVAGPANPPWDPRALWTRLIPKLDWHFVPGNHWTMLHAHFEHSARALGTSVDRAKSPL